MSEFHAAVSERDALAASHPATKLARTGREAKCCEYIAQVPGRCLAMNNQHAVNELALTIRIRHSVCLRRVVRMRYVPSHAEDSRKVARCQSRFQGLAAVGFSET